MLNFDHRQRRKSLLALFSFALAWFCLPHGKVLAATGSYVRIEQDWEVDLATVDPDQAAPQITLMLEPYPNSPTGGVVLLNYRDTPSFAAGGIQLQLWNDKTTTALQTQNAGALMGPSANNQKIKFTMFQELSSGNLNFGISQGDFLGAWGGPVPPAGWTISMPYSDLATFTGNYVTSDSVAGSGLMVGTTANVTAIKITAVRKYDSSGNYDTETGVQVFP